jgi:hypothetical protein
MISEPTVSQGPPPHRPLGGTRHRWLSRRAMLLHLAVLVIAPSCATAGWWQATRALAGNSLSWVYSVEWPIFAILAVAGWWHLIHEDPAAYEARRAAPALDAGDPPFAVGTLESQAFTTTDHAGGLTANTSRFVLGIAVGVGVQSALGIGVLLAVPYDRPSGWLPSRGETVYLLHAVVGLLLVVGATMLVARVRGGPRPSVGLAWTGLIGIALAGSGGLLSEARSLTRFFGLALMFVGAATAAFAYVVQLCGAHEPLRNR